ncbi:MAG TPA: gluconokinase [Thermomicrobiales bacterium]|nr:gluconokinase [Thermomicrobiales bacterium]
MPSVTLGQAAAPLVLAIDIGSSSVRSLLYDADGRQVEETECQLSHTLRTDSEGASEADPDHLVELVNRCIDRTTARTQSRAEAITAVGITSFWHSLMGIDGDGHPTTPLYSWADKRAGSVVAGLAREFPVEQSIRETGCRIHSSYWPAKLVWLQRTQPDVAAQTATWLSFPDYLALKQTGQAVTSISMASGTGLLAADRLTWYQPLLDAIGLQISQLPPIIDRTDPLPELLPEYRRRWPGLADLPWYPAIGDGAAANVGAGCVGADRVALTVGTSAAMRTIVPDREQMEGTSLGQLWVYRLDRQRKVIGGALSNGGNVTAWLAEHFAQGDFAHLASGAECIAPDGHGLTVLPFLAGERSPSWDDAATGVFAGVRLSTTPAEIYRATLEATAYRLAAIYDDLRGVVEGQHEIHANGTAVLSSPLWLQIMSDVLGHAVQALDAEAEASARGAAICALEAVGAVTTLRPAANAVIHEYQPDPSTREAYDRGRARQRRLEAAVVATRSE